MIDQTQTQSYERLQAALDERTWAQANRRLVAKILSEFMYEEIIAPEANEDVPDGFTLQIVEGLRYEFRTLRREFFGFHRVIPESVVRYGVPAETHGDAPDVITLLEDLHRMLRMDPGILAPALREILNTLVADCHMLQNPQSLSARQWLETPDAWLEGELSAHPWIVANKSRLGFSYADYRNFAPESKKPLRLLWLAARRNVADFRSVPGWNYEELIAGVLDPEDRERFERALKARAERPEDFYMLPVHPWQFENRIACLFARELATKDLIVLGEGRDNYLPQQSIRTLSNLTHPERPFVKLPISILNTSVYRGLPSERTKTAPELSAWLQSMVDRDAFLTEECRIILLGEFASLNVSHPFYSRLDQVPYQYNELLGVIFRESLETRLDDDERALPLAALFERDRYGDSVLRAIIDASELSPAQWIDAFLEAVLLPLLHFLYKYGFVFSPHGQNALIALRNHTPTRLVIKDFVDDANLSVDPLPEHEELPEHIYDLLDSLEPSVLIQWIQSGLFVCVFRYLTEILEDDGLLTETDFWERVVQTMRAYEQRFPELQDRFAHFNMFAPVFPKLTLNSTRLLDIGYADSAERPTASVASMLENPLYAVEQNMKQKVSQ